MAARVVSDLSDFILDCLDQEQAAVDRSPTRSRIAGIRIDANRQIVDAHVTDRRAQCQICDGQAAGHFAAPDGCVTLQLLALPYSGAPGYREEWRP
jgi:hypothetical protein